MTKRSPYQRWLLTQGSTTTKERLSIFQDQVPTVWYWGAGCQQQDRSSNKKNDRLYQRSTYNHIHWSNELWKNWPCLRLNWERIQQTFDHNIIICPTLRWNETYHSKDWIKNDDKAWLVEPKNMLYQWIEKVSQLLAHSETLFIIGDIIADESLDKRRQSLLELTIFGRHRNNYLWLLTKSYSSKPKNLRRQAKTIFVWCLKERADLKMIHDKNNLLTDNELVVVWV